MRAVLNWCQNSGEERCKGWGKIFFSKIVFKECYKGWCKNTWKPQVSVTVIISHCFTLFPCVLHFFNLFSIEFVANRALWVALNLSRITHFSCKFLGPKKSACVNVLTYSTSGHLQLLTRLRWFSLRGPIQLRYCSATNGRGGGI